MTLSPPLTDEKTEAQSGLFEPHDDLVCLGPKVEIDLMTPLFSLPDGKVVHPR